MKCFIPYLPVGFSRQDRGFSALELVVVLLIISILMLVAYQKFTNLAAQNNLMAARDISANLRYGRNMAMNRESAVKIVFSVVSNQYTVYLAGTNGIYATAKDPATRSDWIVNVGMKSSEARLSTVSIGGGSANTVVFSPTNGIPYDGSGLLLTANGVITLQGGLSVTITTNTGYVSVPG